MELPAFAKQRTDLVWDRRGRTLHTSTPEVTFTAHSGWYSFGRWTITAVSKLGLPARVTVYISRQGSAHGYFHNAPFMTRDYFGYSDVPALMSVLVGDKTRDAVISHDNSGHDPEAGARIPVALHIHDGSVETTTKTDGNDSRVLDAVIAIHQALADDHADLLDRWKAAADQVRGSMATTWPPVLTVPRAFGSTTIALRWPPSMQSGSQASIEFSVDAHGAKLWSIEHESEQTPNARTIGDRPFLVMGTIPIPAEQLARIVARAEIVSINVRRYVSVRIARDSPDPEVFETVLDLLGHVCGASSAPYR